MHCPRLVPTTMSSEAAIITNAVATGLLVVFLGVSQAFASTTVIVKGISATQAVLAVESTETRASCTYEISQSASMRPLIHDADPTLFSHAGLDEANTASEVDKRHRLFVVGRRSAEPAFDGRQYSRAMEANAIHYYRVTCGADVVTGTFTTSNPPLGNAYPELPKFDLMAFGNVSAPSTEGRQDSSCIVDPMTGICLYRVTRPGDGGVILTGYAFSYAFDATGSWGLPGAGGRQATVSTFSTSSVGAPLFLSWNEITFGQTSGGANFNPFEPTIDDLRLNLTGAGSGSVIGACISLDGGKTCSSDTIHLSPVSGTQNMSGPGTFPSSPFAGWGRGFSAWDINNRSGTGASTIGGSNSVVAGLGSFNVDWHSGIKFLIHGSGCNGNDVCTVASVNSSSKLTTVESIPNTVANVAWQAFAAGLLIKLESGPSLSVRATYDYAQSAQSIMGDSTAQSYCSALPLNDISTNRDGAPLSTPAAGRLCVFTTGLYLLTDDGETRLLSRLTMNSSSPLPGTVMAVSTGGSFSTTDPKIFYGVTPDNILFQGSYSGNYSVYHVGHSNNGYLDWNKGERANDDQVSWTPVMVSGGPSDINVQIRNDPRFAPYPPAFFGPLQFLGFGQQTAFYRLSAPGPDAPCIFIRYDLATKTIAQVLSSWDNDVRWGGCHVGLVTVGDIQIGTFNFINGNNGLPLNGPFKLSINQVKKNGTWSTNTSLTESKVKKVYGRSPLVITTALAGGGDNEHGLIDGEPVSVWTPGSLNALTSGVESSPGSLFVKASWSDTSLSSALDSNSTTLNVADTSRLVDHVLIRIDKELISCDVILPRALSSCVRGALNTQAASHNDGALARQANSLALFKDTQLSTPFEGNPGYDLSSIAGYTYLMDLEQCPDGLAPMVPSMRDDTIGAKGRRCNTIRVTGEPRSAKAFWTELSCSSGGLASLQISAGIGSLKTLVDISRWQVGQQLVIIGAANASVNGTFSITALPDANTVRISMPGAPDGLFTDQTLAVRHPTEHYAYPFKGDLTDLNSSSLHDLNEGDFIHDSDPSLNIYSEQMVVVRKVKHSETDIELTIMRFWGDRVNCDRHNDLNDVLQHRDGWSPLAVSGAGCIGTFAFAAAGDSKWTLGETTFAQSHSAFMVGAIPGTYSFASGSRQSIVNMPFAQLVATIPVDGVAKELPVFANSAASLSYDNKIQEYVAVTQSTATPSEKVWKADFHALNASFGNAQEALLGLTSGMSIQNIRGTQYDPAGATKNLYRVVTMPSGLDRKNIPVTGYSGYHYLGDHSGPASTLDDSNVYQFCIAEGAEECRPHSKPGDVFLNVPSADIDPSGHCYTNAWEYNFPCLFSANTMGGWALQQRLTPVDTNASGSRRLTMGLVNPGRHFTFTNWVPTPDAKWGLLSPPWVSGLRNDIFAMRLPPWPASDNVDRSNFVPFAVQVQALPQATTARALFGYKENGNPEDFFCTTRRESCTTSGTPFAWLSDQQQLKSCFSGCTINIPTIAGRVVYYRIEWMDSTGAVLSRGPLAAAISAP